MRIRRRPRSPLHPFFLPSPPPDLSSTAPQEAATTPAATPTPATTEGRKVVAAEGVGAVLAGGGGEGLHPSGDPLPINPNGCTKAAGGGGDRPPSDSHLPTGMSRVDSDGQMKGSGLQSSPSHVGQVLQQEQQDEEVDAHKRWNMGVNSNKSPGAEASQASPSHGGVEIAVGRWCDGEMAIPLKKRRGGYGVRGGGGDEEEQKKKAKATKAWRDATVVTTTTTSTSIVATSNGASTAKRCDDVAVKEETGRDGVDGNRKRRRSPAMLMEGSRCSRVNGRGWRCCQQTLVGYSLCEHHLGKGRLRNMNSVRCNPKHKKKGGENGRVVASSLPSQLQKKQQYYSVEEDEVEEEKPLKKTRKKIGMVKARSISSLLDQTNHATTMPPPPPASHSNSSMV